MTGRPRTLLGFGLLGLWWGTWGAAVPEIQAHAHADDGQLGIALLSVAVGALLAMRAVGRLLDRSGPWVMPAIAGALGVAALGPAAATTPAQLTIAMLLIGACSGALDVAINLEGVRAESAGPPVIALGHATFSAAVLTAAPLAGLLRAAGAALPVVLGAAAGLILVGAVAVTRLPAAPRGDGPAERPPPPWRAPAHLIVLGLLLALAFLIEGTWQDWGALHLERTLGASRGVGAAGPVTFAGAAVVGRLGAHRLAGRVADRTVLGGGALVAAAGTLLAAAAGSVPVALAGILLAGLGTSVCAPTIFRLGGRAAGAGTRGDALGVVTTLAYLGFLVGPAMVGGIAQATSLPLALGCVSGVAVLLALGSRAV